ncbi:MAG: TIGR02757 family protein [Deltaproteobacteria bacterium]|nr:TIGR02757 family protein [Deltaproteobacteria bacterium]
MTSNRLKTKLDELYEQYNRVEYIHPDPLEFLLAYSSRKDREIVGLVASSLAYGHVSQILKSVAKVLDAMGTSPYTFIMKSTRSSLRKTFKGFVHRFATGDHLSDLLLGAKMVIQQYGSLNQCFSQALSEEDTNTLTAMGIFIEKMLSWENDPGHLMARPEKGSACKRMNLFLRWMVRQDRVDPGVWKDIPPSKLIIPLDTHMHRISQGLCLTEKKHANLNTALEITERFKKICPEDPVKYDFTLTRFGIRAELCSDQMFARSVVSHK